MFLILQIRKCQILVDSKNLPLVILAYMENGSLDSFLQSDNEIRYSQVIYKIYIFHFNGSD